MDEEINDPSFPVFGALKTNDLRRDAIDALDALARAANRGGKLISVPW